MQLLYKNNITTIIFLGFPNMDKMNLTLFILLLMMYCVTICGNLLIILLVSCSKVLHSPMYFFLTQLSITDILLTTDISPNILNILLHEQTSMSLSGCITQLYFSGLSIASECFLLMVMSYDRYLAICSPLRYASIMNQALCLRLIFASWLLSCSLLLILTLGACQLQFCGPNTIQHLFCDLNALAEISCSDVSIIQMESTLLCIPVIVVPFLVIVISYSYIVIIINKISSFSGRLKTFSTCSSHLTTVSIFYGTLFATYMLPNQGQSHMSKIMSTSYTVFTPLLNPFIYSLRNTDIKEALTKLFYNTGTCCSKSRKQI